MGLASVVGIALSCLASITLLPAMMAIHEWTLPKAITWDGGVALGGFADNVLRLTVNPFRSRADRDPPA
jgi:hypothetical protein